LFGSDNPFAQLQETARRMKALNLSAAELRAIGPENTPSLLPNVPRA
jgi:predicted TIM-barrel fold metal-dependent hydrolase